MLLALDGGGGWRRRCLVWRGDGVGEGRCVRRVRVRGVVVEFDGEVEVRDGEVEELV